MTSVISYGIITEQGEILRVKKTPTISGYVVKNDVVVDEFYLHFTTDKSYPIFHAASADEVKLALKHCGIPDCYAVKLTQTIHVTSERI